MITRGAEIVAEGVNLVTTSHDPTAHAEIIAIREACRKLRSHQLTGCTVYTSCEPCPMCLGAIYWARPDQVVFAGTREDAAAAGFDDQFIYDELPLPHSQRRIPMRTLLRNEALALFDAWRVKPDKTAY